jgi:hypothetical protein
VVLSSTMDSEFSDRSSDPREALCLQQIAANLQSPSNRQPTARAPTCPAGLSAQNFGLPPAARAAEI